MVHRFDELEAMTEKAHQASDLRMLGFSEKAITNLLEMSTQQIQQTIRKYQDALDLMGDETD